MIILPFLEKRWKWFFIKFGENIAPNNSYMPCVLHNDFIICCLKFGTAHSKPCLLAVMMGFISMFDIFIIHYFYIHFVQLQYLNTHLFNRKINWINNRKCSAVFRIFIVFGFRPGKNPICWWSLPWYGKMVMWFLAVGWKSKLHNGFPSLQELTSGSHIKILFNLSQIWDKELWIHLVTCRALSHLLKRLHF